MGDAPVPAPEARRSSPQEVEERRGRAFDLDQKIKQDLGKAWDAWWVLAEGFYHFRAGRHWLDLQLATEEEWLAQPEIGLTKTQFHRLASLWEEYVVVRGVPSMGLSAVSMSKADIVLPAVKRGDVSVEKALDDAQAMGQRDLREEYGRRDHGKPLDPEREPERVECPLCHTWVEPQRLEGGA